MKSYYSWLICFLFATVTVFAQPESALNIYKDLKLFKSPLALALKNNVKKSDIGTIQNPQLRELANLLLNKQYNPAYRVAKYKAFLDPVTLGKELMIGDGYSKYENLTGIFLPIGKHLILVDHIAKGKKLGLIIPNWYRHAADSIDPTKDPLGWGIIKQNFDLHNGPNIIDVKNFGGLAYLEYYSDNPKKENTITVHFPAAKVNGYFDIQKNNDADWNKLIENAVYPIIDAKGRYIQIAYPAEACKKYAPNRGVELIRNYDSLVYRQYRLMGLIKYNKVPFNHILARVNYNYYMFRDEDGVAYMGTKPGYAMPLVVDPSRVIKGDPCWGFSHEVGHVHQLRPHFNWGGLGEVSNNVFSMYVTTSFGNKSRLSEMNSYQKARDTIINKKMSYLQDKDVFDRLVPFWQLQLYFAGAGKNPDFYKDLFEEFRKQGNIAKAGKGGWGDRGDDPAFYQLNFIKTACQVSKTNLIDFFDQYGFFYIGDFNYDDYGNYRYKMTEEMVDACKAEIRAMNFPKPLFDIATVKD